MIQLNGTHSSAWSRPDCVRLISAYSMLHKQYISFADHVFASLIQKTDLRNILFFFQKESVGVYGESDA